MANFLTDLKNTIFKENVDSIYELTEFSIDTLLSSDKVKEILKNNNELIKEFPIIKTIIGVKNTAQTIHNINLLRQTYMFVLAFNSGTIDKEKLVKYQKNINSDKKKADKELGRIIIILNKTIEETKSTMIGHLFRNYVNEKIKWEEFEEFVAIVNSIFLRDLDSLKNIYIGRNRETKDYPIFSINRLIALGLIDISEKREGMSFEMDTGYSHRNSNIAMTKIGGKFYESIIEK